jgi:hypothetical protein
MLNRRLCKWLAKGSAWVDTEDTHAGTADGEAAVEAAAAALACCAGAAAAVAAVVVDAADEVDEGCSVFCRLNIAAMPDADVVEAGTGVGATTAAAGADVAAAAAGGSSPGIVGRCMRSFHSRSLSWSHSP